MIVICVRWMNRIIDWCIGERLRYVNGRVNEDGIKIDIIMKYYGMKCIEINVNNLWLSRERVYKYLPLGINIPLPSFGKRWGLG